MLLANNGSILANLPALASSDCSTHLEISTKYVATIQNCNSNSKVQVHTLDGKLVIDKSYTAAVIGAHIAPDGILVITYDQNRYLPISESLGTTPMSAVTLESSIPNPTHFSCHQKTCLLTTSSQSFIFVRERDELIQKAQGQVFLCDGAADICWIEVVGSEATMIVNGVKKYSIKIPQAQAVWMSEKQSLVQYKDGSLQHLSSGSVDWSREEALSHLDDILFVELQPHHGGDLYGLKPILVGLNGNLGVVLGLNLDSNNNANALSVTWKYQLNSICQDPSKRSLTSIEEGDSIHVQVICDKEKIVIEAAGKNVGKLVGKSQTATIATIPNNAAIWGITNTSIYGSIASQSSTPKDPTWLFTLPSPQVICAWSHVPWEEPLHSYAKLTGPKTALPKYLNKNLLAVAGQVPGSSGIFVYLLDSINGNLLFSISHENGTGPVHIVASENFVVYHFWNREVMSFEVGVMELFETEFQWQNPNK